MHLVKKIGGAVGLLLLGLLLVPVLATAHAGLMLGLGAVGLGAVISLRIGQRTVALDTDKPASADDYYTTLAAHETQVREAAETPLRTQLSAVRAENDLLRSALASEILRVRKLTGGEDFDEAAERLYLLGGDDTPGLPAARLRVEYDRAVQQDLKHKPASDGGDPVPSSDPYAAL